MFNKQQSEQSYKKLTNGLTFIVFISITMIIVKPQYNTIIIRTNRTNYILIKFLS